MNGVIDPVWEAAAKFGAGVTAGVAGWSWVAPLNDILQLVVTGLAILTGIATYRYLTAKRKLMEEQLREHKKVEHDE